ncbi:MAG: hypothetical protein V3R29_02980 [Candidatus Acidoferrales bacterium]
MIQAKELRLGCKFFLVLLVCGPAAAVASQEQATAPAPGLEVQEELIAEKGGLTPAADEEDIVSPDGQRVAWRVKRGQKWVVMVNGEELGAEYEKVEWIIFSPNSQRLAYRAKRGDNRWVMVVDGEPGPEFEKVGDPSFSPDSQSLAYVAKRRKKWVMVVDGQEQGSGYRKMGRPLFSPDSQRLACAARRKGRWVIVTDGKEGSTFDILGGLAFSGDSRRFAYAGARVRKGFGRERADGYVVIDGEEGPAFKGRNTSSLGGAFLKGAFAGVKKVLITGLRRRLLPEWHGVSSPALSPDGQHVAYAARRGKKDTVVMFDGQPGPQFETVVAGPAFSPDSQHVAYVVKEKATITLVLDGNRISEFSWEGMDFGTSLTFSPDSRRLAYVGVKGGHWYDEGWTGRARRRVFLDGQPGKEYDAWGLANLTFSPDNQHFAYEAHDIGNGKSLVVVDGQEGKLYDQVMMSLSFSGESSITYVAREGRKFYRVTQTVQ